MSYASLIQYRSDRQGRGVAFLDPAGAAWTVRGAATTLELARLALRQGKTLRDLAEASRGEAIDLNAVDLLSPIDHPDPAHLTISGTGLTHLGSAQGRDQMHRAAATGADLTDSMKMFQMGVEGGRPARGEVGVQPEWFYKGDGASLVAPGAPITSPDFALDAGEEPELAGIYLIDEDGTPVRLGFSIGNEFSDHVTERGNYLWLAHSKLRQASLGPELLLGSPPQSVRGTSRIVRDTTVIWEREFLTGEANMSHSFANLEHHHFKYGLFRRPGDLHVHFFGTATISFADGVRTKTGDVFEIEASPFRLPLRNEVVVAERARNGPIAVKPL